MGLEIESEKATEEGREGTLLLLLGLELGRTFLLINHSHF